MTRTTTPTTPTSRTTTSPTTLTTTDLARTAPAAGAADRPRRAVARRPSARLRILAWYAGLLAVALATALILQSTLLHAQLDAEVDQGMAREVEELRFVIEERDPATGLRLRTGVDDAFDTHLARAVLLEGAALFTLVDGRPYKSTVAPVQLLERPELVAAWAAATTTTTGEVDTEEGAVRWMAVPLLDGERVDGTFIVANFLAGERAEIDEAVRVGTMVFLGVAILATIVAWLLAGRILRPIRLLTETAHGIGEDDWSRRIEVDGNDDVAELARTFNAMLDRLETAYSTQRRFIDDAGHELATPITIIRGHLETMTDDPADRAASMAIVLDELDRMSRMVDDLLVLARSQQPDFIVPGPVDLADLTTELVRKAEALSDRPWRVDARVAGMVLVDRQRIVQAVMNLARNAIAYTPPGTTLAIGTTHDGRILRLWVRDEGPGIAEAERTRILERFARGSGGTRRSDGTGLGLSIVEAIAVAHGGALELDSTVGQGSTFTLAIPAGPEA
jgi:signal transduction histidine kinase